MPRSSTTQRARSAATTPSPEERADALLQVEAQHHRDAVLAELLLAHAPGEHEVRRHAAAELAQAGGEHDAAGFICRLLARRKLDLVRIAVVLVRRPEESLGIPAAI